VGDRRPAREPPTEEAPGFRVASRIVEAGGGDKGTGNESRGLGVEKWKAAEDALMERLLTRLFGP
jgi:hypothetical protein